MQRIKELAMQELVKRGYSSTAIEEIINPPEMMPEMMPEMITEMIPEMISITEVSEQLPDRPRGLSAMNKIVDVGQSAIRELD